MKITKVLIALTGYLVGLGGISINASDFYRLAEELKQPAVVNIVSGQMPNNYNVIYTTITKGKPKADAKADTKTDATTEPETSKADAFIIQRSVIGTVNNSSSRPINVNKKLLIPQAPIELQTNVADNLASVAGMINPKAGAAGAAISGLIDEGLNIAGQVLTKKYNLSALNTSLIELIPSKYYSINDNIITPTADFTKALETFQELAEKYKKLAKDYDTKLAIFQEKKLDYDRLKNQKALGDLQEAQNNWWPLFNQKIAIENELGNLAIHRFAIMSAATPDSAKGCGDLFLYVYLGSKLVNKYSISYCGNKDKEQKFDIHLYPNMQDVYQNFSPGGIQLEQDNNISFSNGTDNGKKSQKYIWFDTGFDTVNDTIDSYLIPYDLLDTVTSYEGELKEKNQKRSDTTTSNIANAVKQFTGAISGEVSSSKDKDRLNALANKVAETGTTVTVKETAKTTTTVEQSTKVKVAEEKAKEEAPETANASKSNEKELTDEEVDKAVANFSPETRDLVKKVNEGEEDAAIYRLLGIPENASDAQVDKGYKDLVAKFPESKISAMPEDEKGVIKALLEDAKNFRDEKFNTAGG